MSTLSDISWREQASVVINQHVSWIFIVLEHSNSHYVDMSLHSDTLSWFRVNQSLILLPNVACSGRVKYTNVIVRGLFRGEHSNDYTTSQKEPTSKQVTVQIITEKKQVNNTNNHINWIRTDDIYSKLIFIHKCTYEWNWTGKDFTLSDGSHHFLSHVWHPSWCCKRLL
jgi:hypothetical protein